ncbi:Sua5/YciO/YrdC family protein [Streptomyces venezuelae]|nr:Sua5/YciO/YrdC family protein [Streptomyces venezuelae]CUM43999.1 TsaC protein (YrdC domain) required for threonylcarbamoyladenosine t(6)A37 modification in tRNA [Streptomyces venezuelae]
MVGVEVAVALQDDHAEVEEFLTGADLDAVVMDGGVCPAANHLTIIDCASDQTNLGRAGLVHPRAVASVLDRGPTDLLTRPTRRALSPPAQEDAPFGSGGESPGPDFLNWACTVTSVDVRLANEPSGVSGGT